MRSEVTWPTIPAMVRDAARRDSSALAVVDGDHRVDFGSLWRMVDDAARALEATFGRSPVYIREGGSIPFVTQMHDTFKVPCVLMGFGLPDENAHAPDEHILLENYFGGIKAVANFYQGLGNL